MKAHKEGNFVIMRDDGETWREYVQRIARRNGLERECLEFYDEDIARGESEQSAAFYALWEWDCVELDEQHSKRNDLDDLLASRSLGDVVQLRKSIDRNVDALQKSVDAKEQRQLFWAIGIALAVYVIIVLILIYFIM